MQREEAFVSLSAALTGFTRVELLGTGMADVYLAELDHILPTGTLDGLLAAYVSRSADGGEAALELLHDATWGPVADRVTILWYTGTWTALPEAWHAAHGGSTEDTTHVVSAAAYQSGLQWAVVDAHPAGARPQGFGAWALAPSGVQS